jgi:hypothetical protein
MAAAAFCCRESPLAAAVFCLLTVAVSVLDLTDFMPKVTPATKKLRESIAGQLFRLPGRDWTTDRLVEQVDL